MRDGRAATAVCDEGRRARGRECAMRANSDMRSVQAMGGGGAALRDCSGGGGGQWRGGDAAATKRQQRRGRDATMQPIQCVRSSASAHKPRIDCPSPLSPCVALVRPLSLWLTCGDGVSWLSSG